MLEEVRQLLEVELQQLTGDKRCVPDDYEALHILGQGAHGQTRVVRRRGDVLCRKHIPYERFPTSRPSEVLREVEILMLLDGHPHIIGFVGAFLGEGGLNIVQEYAEGGTLQQRIDRRREHSDPLLESEILDTFIQIVGALAHMHDLGVLHRDVKPANVFFDRRNLCRLGDFGIAAFIKCAALSAAPLVPPSRLASSFSDQPDSPPAPPRARPRA